MPDETNKPAEGEEQQQAADEAAGEQGAKQKPPADAEKEE